MLIQQFGFVNCKTIAIIGAGGKTTLLWHLARESALAGERVLVTTSTHLYLPTEKQCDRIVDACNPQAVQQAIAEKGITAALTPAENGRYTGLHALPFAAVSPQADRTFYEADGSRMHPVKLHAPYEPVLYPGTDGVLLVCGLSAIGRAVSEVCHRSELLPAFAQQPNHTVTQDDMLTFVKEAFLAANSPQKCYVVLNQADTVTQETAQRLCDRLHAEGFCAAAMTLQPQR